MNLNKTPKPQNPKTPLHMKMRRKKDYYKFIKY
jgi:hypothetical protein